jgi:hypothetical protein
MHSKQVVDNMRRTTVSFEDDQFEILEKWADKEIRTVPNLIQAIVVSVLRGESPNVPDVAELEKLKEKLAISKGK